VGYAPVVLLQRKKELVYAEDLTACIGHAAIAYPITEPVLEGTYISALQWSADSETLLWSFSGRGVRAYDYPSNVLTSVQDWLSVCDVVRRTESFDLRDMNRGAIRKGGVLTNGLLATLMVTNAHGAIVDVIAEGWKFLAGQAGINLQAGRARRYGASLTPCSSAFIVLALSGEITSNTVADTWMCVYDVQRATFSFDLRAHNRRCVSQEIMGNDDTNEPEEEVRLSIGYNPSRWSIHP
jgi:hypothetical protein